MVQVNGPCHAARATQAMLAEHNIQLMPWPAKSPDLHLIKNTPGIW